jgi:hypothetical protein
MATPTDYIKQMKDSLKGGYKNLFGFNENRPEEWAVRKNTNPNDLVHPAIPFVGKNYEHSKLLLYASAENLVGYDGYLDDDIKAINRRYIFLDGDLPDTKCHQLKEAKRQCDKGQKLFFPNVHIIPVYDGSLVIVSAYILKVLGIRLGYTNPYEFLENIAVDNFCKFSIERENKNKDYANDMKYLKYSINYVKKDLETLKPKIIIMPKEIYKHKEIEQTITNIIPSCTIIPIFQINSRTINRHIKKYPQKDIKDIDKQFICWQEELTNGITGKTNKNFNSIYTYLEEICKNIE